MLVLRVINGATLASLLPLAVSLVADSTSETARGKIYGSFDVLGNRDRLKHVETSLFTFSRGHFIVTFRWWLSNPWLLQGYIQMCVTLGMMAVAMIGTTMSHATILNIQGWRVAIAMIGSFPIFTAILIKVFMHEARREKTWEPGSKRRGCDGAKDEMRKLGVSLKMVNKKGYHPFSARKRIAHRTNYMMPGDRRLQNGSSRSSCGSHGRRGSRGSNYSLQRKSCLRAYLCPQLGRAQKVGTRQY